MRYTWEQAFSGDREAQLVGNSSENLLDASERLSLKGGMVSSCFVEGPLLGTPCYDSLVIHNPRFLYPCCRVSDPSQEMAQKVLDWASKVKTSRPYIHFELDELGAGALSGIHCRIEGNMSLAAGFFEAIGEPWRISRFTSVYHRLPESWFLRYSGVFIGRGSNNTRLEVAIQDDKARQALCDPNYIKQCFDQIGFHAYSDEMLEDMACLTRVDVPLSIQFDLLDDGFMSTCSLLSMYEHVRPDCSPLFREDGILSKTCRIYEDMGVCDERWKLLEKCCFSKIRYFKVKEGIKIQGNNCFMCCTKAKWIEGNRTFAKYYLMMDSKWEIQSIDSVIQSDNIREDTKV